ncbi:MAG: polysaccharide pyruvyl transferase family protein [Burkholderiales bacterium]
MTDAVSGVTVKSGLPSMKGAPHERGPLRKLLGRVKHDVRVWLAVKRLIRQWRELAQDNISKESAGLIKRLIILPTDPFTLVGSKGDEAMIQGVVQRLTSFEPTLRVGMVTASTEASGIALRMGFEPLPIWSEPWVLGKFVSELSEFSPDALVVIGADVMDGYYSPNTALRLLASADILARRGVRATITGFSFNRTPSPHLKPVFDNAFAALRINIRDSPSLERFQRFSRTAATLVADVAFMLQPDARSPKVAALSEWIAGRRSAGDAILGFNIHPMLVRDGSPSQVRLLVDAATCALRQISQDHRVSVVLLSHDERGAVGDDVCLGPLYEVIHGDMPERLVYPRASLSAGELKAAAGLMDGVFTGRMHLAIASLGMGVPVAALTYQDKFQGLFDHFGLPSSLLLTPEQAIKPGQLDATLKVFVSDLPQLRRTVAEALPSVLRAAERNFAGLVPDVSTHHQSNALA